MNSLMKYISRTHRASNVYKSASLLCEGLNSCQHIYIFHICRNPGISQDKLAKKISVNKSSVTRQLGLLEQNGFIRRESDSEDRRSLKVYPTEKAEGILPLIRNIMREWNEGIVEELTEGEREILISLMNRVMNKALQLAGIDEKEEDAGIQ